MSDINNGEKKEIAEQLSTNTSDSNKGLFEREAGFWSNPSDEQNKGFFSKLTDSQSQRENWYKVSPYIGEFWCALSNVGFIYVGIKHKSPELLFAGVASIISHCIPKQWLLYVDKLGVLVVLSKVIREYKVVMDNPRLLAPVGLAVSINATDAYLARNKGVTLPHVVWHLSAAVLANEFLKIVK